jgi:hypothetical protein
MAAWSRARSAVATRPKQNKQPTVTGPEDRGHFFGHTRFIPVDDATQLKFELISLSDTALWSELAVFAD